MGLPFENRSKFLRFTMEFYGETFIKPLILVVGWKMFSFPLSHCWYHGFNIWIELEGDTMDKKCYSWCHKETDTLSLAVHFHLNIDTMRTIASLWRYKKLVALRTTEESVGS